MKLHQSPLSKFFCSISPITIRRSSTKYKGTNGMPPPWGTGGGLYVGIRRMLIVIIAEYRSMMVMYMKSIISPEGKQVSLFLLHTPLVLIMRNDTKSYFTSVNANKPLNLCPKLKKS